MMAPDTEEALAEAILSAKTSLRIQGGATRGVDVGGTALSSTKLTGISLYEPGALTIVLRAGTPVTEVEAALAAEKQRLAFEPPDYRPLLGTAGVPTIGGVIATNASGPRRIQGGAARDYALGVRFVDGGGNIIKNGGRVMKNVTGYDLVKLMCGAHGTLGVLTEVSLKVLPVPETQGTLLLHGLGVSEAIAALSKAMGSPYEVTGAAHFGGSDSAVTALRIEGFEQSVDYRLKHLKKLLSTFGSEMEIIAPEQTELFWTGVRNAEHIAKPEGDVWRIHCKPSDAARLAAIVPEAVCLFDWGGGLIWVRTHPGVDLRARLGQFDGHATLVRADTQTAVRLGRFHPETPGVARLSAGLRARFDPRGILNRGLMNPMQSECA